ncbi:hypothetical protein Cgig2_007234 [Carnegiea gigantea]|uniref:26S proteasome regulatory subunit RPN5 C-terminal domain-containing protein n=1 Tax=Carnegiea gigantea TaxID=171969 RepID=A0A9Q1KVN7_9CARY|nr:hypothetical protein Cgig2_007234 [Carnegiea gigantea]
MAYQVHLCLDRQNYVGAQILPRRISPRVFDVDPPKEKERPKEGDATVEEAPADVPYLLELKRIYYELMIRTTMTMELCRCYKSIYEIASIQEDLAQWIPILRKICWCLAFASHNPMQSSLLNSTLEDKNLSVILWSVVWSEFKDEFDNKRNLVADSLGNTAGEDLRQKFQDAEKHLSDMAVSRAMVTKIDMPMVIAYFQVVKDNNEILNSWSMNLEKLLDLVEESCHQIHRNDGSQSCS